ncbi:MAG: M1 family peptidase, partial [Ekhidna sp.]|nr:M1 family peptidase [Ekhidna sp.]
MKKLCFCSLLLFFTISGYSQSTRFTSERNTYSRQDSLRGSITPERAWWDVLHYDLKVDINIESQTINGSNIITYKVLENHNILQIDLQLPMIINEVTQEGKALDLIREGNAHFVTLIKDQVKDAENSINITFSGKPRTAIRAPWDGGFSWTKDENGKPFVATSNQGLGASIWWPCKDHPYDEPDDGQLLSITVPKELIAVGNGRLVDTKNLTNKKTYVWRVVNPINSYGVNVNIGDYTNISSSYNGMKGKLDVDFWVLRQNKAKAEEQFQDAYRVLEALEYWFGPYPFYEDSYKLVE